MYAEIETEKRLALIKAWEESEKTKVENRYKIILLHFFFFLTQYYDKFLTRLGHIGDIATLNLHERSNNVHEHSSCLTIAID